MNDRFTSLEQHIERVAATCKRLQNENRRLMNERDHLAFEQRELQRKLDFAEAHILRSISKLKTMAEDR